MPEAAMLTGQFGSWGGCAERFTGASRQPGPQIPAQGLAGHWPATKVQNCQRGKTEEGRQGRDQVASGETGHLLKMHGVDAST